VWTDLINNIPQAKLINALKEISVFSQRDALEALEFAYGLLDTSPELVEFLWKEAAPGRRNVSPDDRAVEELHQMCCGTLLGQQLEKRHERAAAVEPPEPLPDTVPVAEFHRQDTPRYIVHREIEDRLQELAVILPRLPTTARRRTP
jgi:hypothetical protein